MRVGELINFLEGYDYDDEMEVVIKLEGDCEKYAFAVTGEAWQYDAVNYFRNGWSNALVLQVAQVGVVAHAYDLQYEEEDE